MTLSWDLFIILAFVVMGVYGFLLGRGRVFNILINTYVGLVIATQLGSYAFDYLTKATQVSHSLNVSMFGAKVFVFVAVIFILTMSKELSGSNDDSNGSSLFTAIYGVLTAGLMLASVFSFMGEGERLSLFSSSNLAEMVFRYQVIWLVAPVLVVLASLVLSKFGKK